jgi:type IV secretory pathway VirB2 component (pilin)
MKTKNITKLISSLFIASLPYIVSAQNTININIPNPAGNNRDLMAILRALLNNVVLPVGAVVVVMYIIYAGFTFVQAQGNPKEIDAAKQRLLWALIGSGILLGAAAISTAVQTTVNQIITL